MGWRVEENNELQPPESQKMFLALKEEAKEVRKIAAATDKFAFMMFATISVQGEHKFCRWLMLDEWIMLVVLRLVFVFFFNLKGFF